MERIHRNDLKNPLRKLSIRQKLKEGCRHKLLPRGIASLILIQLIVSIVGVESAWVEAPSSFVDGFSEELMRPARVMKTVNGVEITKWFAKEEYESIQGEIYFNIYKLEGNIKDKEDGQEPVIEGIHLSGKGYIEFEVKDFGWGWYLIEENYGTLGVEGSAPPWLPFKGEPEGITVYVGPYGIMSNTTVGNMDTVQLQYVPSPAKEAILLYEDGCVTHGIKPTPLNPEKYDGYTYAPGQPFVAEKFITRFSDGEEHFSLCADLGANQVLNDYIIDPDSHHFTDEEIYFLIAAFDYINQLTMGTHGGLRNDLADGTGRGLAQVLLWNVIYEVNGNVGYAEEWPHFGPTCPPVYTEGETKIGGPVKVEGYGDWYTTDISEYTKENPETEGILTYKALIDDMLVNPQKYVEIYNGRERALDEEYVTSALFVIGNNPTLHPIFQQRQLVVIFDKWVALNNVVETKKFILPESTFLDLSGEKVLIGIDKTDKEFTFEAVQVQGFEDLTKVSDGISGSVRRLGAGEFTLRLFGLEIEKSPYYFLIRENSEGADEEGWSYSLREIIVQVIVADQGDGTSTATITERRGSEGMIITEGEVIFTNTYTPPVSPPPPPPPPPPPSPPENLIISVEVDKDTIRRTSAAYESLPGKEEFYNVGKEEEHFRYDVNFRSTSNVAVDEFVVDDPLENVAMGHVRIEGLWTPVVWGSTEGLFNVWFKTNLTKESVTYSNATVRRSTYLPAAYPNTGFKLWEKELATDTQHYLDVSKLNLEAGEYITVIRYEYGGVEVGFTSMNKHRDSWNGEHRKESKAPVELPSINKDKIVPINPLDTRPVRATPLPTVPLMAFGNEMFSPINAEYPPMANSNWNSISGDRVDWTPNPLTHFYPLDFELAADLIEADLKPASYLVSATGAMNQGEIVSSAIARIAKYDRGNYLRDHDQDAVVTKVITTFDTGVIGYQPGDYKIESSFVDNAKIHGFDIRTSGGRNELRKITAAKTGDDSIPILTVMGIVSLVSLILLVLLFDTRGQERKRQRSGNLSSITKGSKKKGKGIRRGAKGLLILLLLIALVAPRDKVYGAFTQPPEDAKEEISENITMEYRYFEGQEKSLAIPETITRFGQVYRLIDTSEPVLEDTLPRTRTYTFRIDGGLSKEDLDLIEGLEDVITLTPVEKVFEREVDKTLVIKGLPTNEVEFLSRSEEFVVAAAGEPGLQRKKALERAGISFKIEAYEESGLERSLPASYEATIVFRGTETYTEVIYYLAEMTYERTEKVGEINRYVVTATYAPTGVRAGIDAALPSDVEEEIEEGDDLSDDISEEIVEVEIEDTKVSEATLQEIILEEIKDAGVPTTRIGDGEVPLYGFSGMPVWALADLIMVILGILLAISVVAKVLICKTCRVKWLILTIMGAIGMGALFILTQNVHNLMVFFDLWSIAFGAILIAGIIGAVLSFRKTPGSLNSCESWEERLL